MCTLLFEVLPLSQVLSPYLILSSHFYLFVIILWVSKKDLMTKFSQKDSKDTFGKQKGVTIGKILADKKAEDLPSHTNA